MGVLRFFWMWTANHSWMELKECLCVDPQRLWEAVSDKGWIQKRLLCQLQLLAASYDVYPDFWLACKVWLCYSGNALCNGLSTTFGKAFTFWQSNRKFYRHNHIIQQKNTFLCISLWYFYAMSISTWRILFQWHCYE